MAAALANIADSLLKGMRKAGSEYVRLTGGGTHEGYPPWFAPEALFRDVTALNLQRDWPADLEFTVRELIHWGRGSRRGRRPRDAGSGRVDLVIFNDDNTPRAAVEFKRWGTLNGGLALADARRLRQLVRRRAVRFGLLALVGKVAVKRRDQLDERLSAAVDHLQGELLDRCWHQFGADVHEAEYAAVYAVVRVW